uniref:Phosphoribosyl-AMP cyclohydrolase domain-containing protein n=1 Tax=Lotharella globosa TaxID=91324 RepID=A0A7S4DMA9_9EUKA
MACHLDCTPICMPTLFVSAGKAVGYGVKAEPVDAVERSKTLGLLGELNVVALDDAPATWEAIGSIVRRGRPIRLEGVRTLDDALAQLDRGVSKIVLPAKTWDSEEAISIIGRYKDRFVAIFEADEDTKKVDEEVKIITTVGKYASEFLMTVKDLASVSDGKSAISSKLKAIAKAAADANVLVGVSGGINTVDQIKAIEKIGLRPTIGDALANGKLEMADLIVPFIRSDRPDKLFTTVVVDEQHVALGLVYSNAASVREAMRKRAGIYHSRRRGLWHKGLSSGATQDLFEVTLDCDRDALRFVVRQNGVGFCHLNRYTCWDSDRGVGHLFRTLLDRKQNPVQGSYTNKLLNKTEMLNAKMLEEATEIIEAKDKNHVAAEAADVLYFASVICTRAGASWKDVENYLDRRSRRVRRRKGDAKPYALELLRKTTAGATPAGAAAAAPAEKDDAAAAAAGKK